MSQEKDDSRRPIGGIKQGTSHDLREMNLMNKLQQFSVS